jgi:hypothetical protein
MESHVQEIIDHSFEYAKDLLVDRGQCYPFGTFIDKAGIVHPLEFEITDKKNIPNNESVIWSLNKHFTTEMENNTILGFGITQEAAVQLEEDADSIETIAIDIVVKGIEDIPIYYFPYEIRSEGDVVFKEAFAVKKA